MIIILNNRSLSSSIEVRVWWDLCEVAVRYKGLCGGAKFVGFLPVATEAICKEHVCVLEYRERRS